ncbi:MAG TPA: hypothetical protein ENH88_22695 [Pseudoalteromonas prydzensis]|uniref:Uncharacterized protein n=1 Tax=Pseudoalteromonas prydzensis TaxID=182141 RepID=A0A7V1GGV8_9GAMM|nr:protein adenylyltransferase SelO family protein [Pseudoalteromonas prydzensis]HEA19208.1 hypothetical protein [Pseudoalteromonas prydzensis]
MQLENFNSSCFINHQVRHYKNPSIAWLNYRWLIEEGVDIKKPSDIEVFEKKVLKEYAFGKPTDAQNEAGFLSSTETVITDRYGATGGSHFGGSGRCSIKNKYIIKGTGRTALTSIYADSDHSNGLIELGEAIREVIYSELFFHELPNQSVPILAIIDTGTKAYFEEDRALKRVALVIRPFFIRPAHFERSIFYDHNPNLNQSSQPIDAKRVQFYSKYFNRMNPGFFEQMWKGIIKQKGAERALRLWSGRFLTSNMEFTGKSVDFGISTSLPSWFKYYHHSKECFGEDAEALIYGMRSTFEQITKYQCKPVDSIEHHGPNHTFNDNLKRSKDKIEGDLMKEFQGFIKAMLPKEIFSKNESINAFCDNLTKEFLLQQKTPVPFLSKMCVGSLENPKIDNEEKLATFVKKLFKLTKLTESSEYTDNDKVSENYLGFIFSNRPDTYYSILRKECSKVCDSLSDFSGANRKSITAFIEATISSSRRYWPLLNTCIVPYKVQCDSISSVVWGTKSSRKDPIAYVEVNYVGDSVHILGKEIQFDAIKKYCINSNQQKWAGLFPSKELESLLDDYS